MLKSILAKTLEFRVEVRVKVRVEVTTDLATGHALLTDQVAAIQVLF